jgi:hypothetical protein
MVISPAWQEVLIECELDNIRFYAGEIGYFKKFLEQMENDEIRQRINFFINYSEIAMEQSNDRLKKLRQDLESLNPMP